MLSACGRNLQQVNEYKKDFQEKLISAYGEQQRKLFLRLDKKLSLMQDRCKLMAYFKGISNKDFCDRYTKRYNSLSAHKDTLQVFHEDYQNQKLLKQKELQGL